MAYADNDDSTDEDRLVDELRDARRQAWKRFQIVQRREAGAESDGSISPDASEEYAHAQEDLPGDSDNESYAAMSDIDVWHDEGLPADEPEVIPEWFLWKVFDQLVDAYTMLGVGRVSTGRNEEELGADKEEGWDEIVHRDGHLMNIFVKPAVGAAGVLYEQESKDAGKRCDRFTVDQVCDVRMLTL
jgi:hypothetical protein